MRPALILLPLVLGACGQTYSPDRYATRAVQQANKVEQGVIIGARKVEIVAEGSTGAAAGAAAGGLTGSQVGQGGMAAALGAVGGGLLGGLIGTATERAVGDMSATEYIVRKLNNELVSVTQRDPAPLPVGERVLVIAGTQARIVRDYTTPGDPPPTTETPPERPAQVIRVEPIP